MVACATDIATRPTNLFPCTEFMIASHLDTIETALTLIQALEKLSPHVGLIKQELLEKKEWCEKQVRELRRKQASDKEDEVRTGITLLCTCEIGLLT